MRFSRDKRPYGPQLHLVLSNGAAFGKVPGVHPVIGPAGTGFGAGWQGLQPEPLDRYRRRVMAERAGFEVTAAQAAGVAAVLDAPDRLRLPKGFAAGDGDHLIRRKSVIVRGGVLPYPDRVFGPEAVAGWRTIVAALAPFAQWLARV